MREIKFRAWEPDTKKMVDVFGVNPMVQKVYLSHQQLFGTAGDDLLLSYSPDEEYSYVRLMQYTGLKDRNGVEIYEGDIIKAKRDDGLYDIGEVVHGSKGAFCLHLPKVATGIKTPLLNYIHGMMFAEHDFKVIGNIYENPELLEALEEV